MSPLIAAEDILELINSPGAVIVDARGGADAGARYKNAHVAGAVFVDLETDLSGKGPDATLGGRHPLPDIQTFARLLGEIGINRATHVVVYDDKAGANAAARFWWMMKAVGHEKVQVVNGGLAALEKVPVPMSTEVLPRRPSSQAYAVTKWLLPLTDLRKVDEARADKEWLVVDVRENYRYRGESEPIDLVAGHIPGAVNLPYLRNLDANGKFLQEEALAETYRGLIGDRDPSKIIVHCGSGVTACHSILAMAVAGFDTPTLYVGSWSEWSRNDKPIAKS